MRYDQCVSPIVNLPLGMVLKALCANINWGLFIIGFTTPWVDWNNMGRLGRCFVGVVLGFTKWDWRTWDFGFQTWD